MEVKKLAELSEKEVNQAIDRLREHRDNYLDLAINEKSPADEPADILHHLNDEE